MIAQTICIVLYRLLLSRLQDDFAKACLLREPVDGNWNETVDSGLLTQMIQLFRVVDIQEIAKRFSEEGDHWSALRL